MKKKSQATGTDNIWSAARNKALQAKALAEQLQRPEAQAKMKAALEKMTPEQRAEFVASIERAQKAYIREICRTDFPTFKKRMWPESLGGAHFDELAKLYHRIAQGERVRAIVNIAPRFGKSDDLSVYFLAWYMGLFPNRKIIHGSAVKDLVTTFGQRIRDLIAREEYKEIFPETMLSKSTKAKDEWATTLGGRYFGSGAQGTVIGRGADLLVVDDPHSDQAAVTGGSEGRMPSKKEFEEVWNWFNQIQARLEPNASVLLVMQRWSPFDLTGRLLQRMAENKTAQRYEVIELPAIFHRDDDEGNLLYDAMGAPVYDSLWPQRWPVQQLLEKRNEMVPWRWAAQYMQNPMAVENSAVRPELWKQWMDRDENGVVVERRPPEYTYVIQAWDTAFSKKTQSDYSACTTWGIFRTTLKDGRPGNAIMLIDAWRGQVDFPDLKKKAAELYRNYKPDYCVTEARATGLPLIQEFNRAGVRMVPYNATWQTGDKAQRLASVTDIFADGLVYVPCRDWVNMVVNEVSSFPHGENDDFVDTVSMALLRFRKGGFITLESDNRDEEPAVRRVRSGKFY